jgi:hypothetical protein
MAYFRKFVAVVALMLSGCGNIQTVISFSTPYQQPISGERARLRVVSFGGMVRAVPNSSCIDWRLPDAGVMVSSMKGFANINGKTLGMPPGQFPGAATVMGTVAISELYIPAGKPITLHYLSGGELRGQNNYQCFISKSFIPVAGKDYESTYLQQGSLCRFGIVQIANSDDADKPSPVVLTDAVFCRASDNF